MDKSVSITFTYEKEEYVQGMRYYLRRSHRVSWVQVVLLLVSLGVMAFIMYLQWPGSLTFLNLFILVLLVLSALVGLDVYVWKPGRVYDKYDSLHQSVTFHFHEEDMVRQTAEAGLSYSWAVESLWKTPQFYFLFQSDGSYFMLPRRAFGGEEAERRFLDLVAQHT